MLNFYLYDYRSKLEKLASSKSKIAETREGVAGTESISLQQKAKNRKEVERLVEKHKTLSKAEITAIVDSLIRVCKYQ